MAKELKFKQGSYKEAAEYFKKKINLPTKRWNDLEGAMHTRAFTVAGAMRADILLDFRKAVDAAIEKGESLQDFRDRFYHIASKWRESDPSFDEKMQRPKYGAWRSKVIYQTNILTSAAAAQERQARTMPDVFTHAKYVCMMMPTSREQHRAWNGTVLPVNDPWWEKHSPPNGFGCLCEKEFISKYEMDSGIEKVTKAPTAPNDTTNIGEKWDYSIGDADAENQRLMNQYQEKRAKLEEKFPEAKKNADKLSDSVDKEIEKGNPEKNDDFVLDLSKIKTVKPKPLTKEELQIEREEREKNFDTIINKAYKKKIKYIAAKSLKKPLSEMQIIEKIGDDDKTPGSCTSQTLAYIANKFGYDVTDYRGRESRVFFSENSTLDKLTKSGGFKVVSNNGFKNAESLLKHVEKGKEYLFTSGEHTVIVRLKPNTQQKENVFEFLELQYEEKEKNGYKLLTNSVLKERFKTRGVKKIGDEEVSWVDFLIDINKIKDSLKFRELVGFFNTRL
ncbi:MAG: hypothetical protein MJY78_02660 [Fibrobacter sp.]|nr:hypothetical protein [Fibrobacter sp.]